MTDRGIDRVTDTTLKTTSLHLMTREDIKIVFEMFELSGITLQL